MELNTYIKQNQLNPNPTMLSQLGASQELINYLLYTPENTNFGMFDSIGESKSDWVKIRLEKTLVYEEEGNKEYAIASKDEKDIEAFANLIDLYQSNECPIITINYSLTIPGEQTYTGYLPLVYLQGDNEYCEILQFPQLITAYYDANENIIYGVPFEDESQNSDYIEITYKIGNYYTITIGYNNEQHDCYVEPSTTWTVPDMSLGGETQVLYSENATYHENDVITFNHDMTLIQSGIHNVEINSAMGGAYTGDIPVDESGNFTAGLYYWTSSIAPIQYEYIGEPNKTQKGISIYSMEPFEAYLKVGTTVTLSYNNISKQIYGYVGQY